MNPTGGRKAKSIGINPSYRYAMGIVITCKSSGNGAGKSEV